MNSAAVGNARSPALRNARDRTPGGDRRRLETSPMRNGDLNRRSFLLASGQLAAVAGLRALGADIGWI